MPAVGKDAGGTVGQQRILIPVILALGYNRWNQLYSDDFGITLQLVPILLGFFTYKFAVLGRQGLQLMTELSQGVKESASGSSSGQGGQEGGGDFENGSMTLDRIFIKRALRE